MSKYWVIVAILVAFGLSVGHFVALFSGHPLLARFFLVFSLLIIVISGLIVPRKRSSGE